MGRDAGGTSGGATDPYCTARYAFGCVGTPLTFNTTRLSPLGKLGTRILNWYSPEVTSPANWTVAGNPPMVAVTVLAVGGAPVNSWLKSVVGLVGPKPVP